MEKNKMLPPLENQVPSSPGIGVGGMVMCPFKQFPQPCAKQGCELWVELNYGPKVVGRCSFAWNAIVATETRTELEKLRKALTNPPIITP